MRTRILGLLTAAVASAVVTGIPAVTQAAPPATKTVYLTFDDGPNGLNDVTLLHILHRDDVRATFFFVGRELAADPKAVQRFWLAGHAVGNHTYNHADLTKLSREGIDTEILSTQRVLGPLAGPCVRPPYGAVSPAVNGAIASLGLREVLWNVDPEDWAHQNTPYIVNAVLSHVFDKSVVLLHDGGGNRAATVRAVRQLIPALRARGYQFKTVRACRVPLKVTATGMALRPKPTPTPVPTPTVSPSPTPSVSSP